MLMKRGTEATDLASAVSGLLMTVEAAAELELIRMMHVFEVG